jgi:hypothetical protein
MLPGLGTAMMGGVADAVSSLSLTIYPASAHKTQTSTDGLSHTLTTPSVLATATGGSGTYTYGWARIAGDSSITATSPATASTAFSASMPPETDINATFRCTVTDTVTGAQRTADIEVNLHHVSLA